MAIFLKLTILLATIVVASSRSATKPLPFADRHDRNMHPDDDREINESFSNTPKQLAEQDANFWLRNANDFVQKQLNKKLNRNRAKNIILFMGDGMSVATLSATRVYMGGEELTLELEKFDHMAMSRTYCVNYQVADSACTSTAYLSGVKANYGTIGVNARVSRGHCETGQNATTHTSSIAEWAMAAGKVAGLVTTTRVTHASPAGVYAHAAERDWENNVEVQNSGCDDGLVDDIAEQLIGGPVGPKLRVVMGGGRREFLPKSVTDAEGKKGKRTDNKNLIEDWLQLDGDRQFIWSREELLSVNASETDYLLGLFEHSHCRYNLEIKNEGIEHLEPSLAEMVDKATDILSKNEEGFFLFVEGGLIDRGHHDTKAHYALEETVEFDRAIALARAKFSDEDTLIVVTADHSHTMTYAGYANRANDVLGIGGTSNRDNVPYMTLSYANGPSFSEHFNEATGERVDPLTMDIASLDFVYPSAVPLDSETHGGDDVVIYASGPWSHLFEGTVEQNVIPHVMAFAGCLGDGLKMCDL